MDLFLAQVTGFDLEDLDAFGSLDDLDYSLDDAFWADAELILIVGQGSTPSGAAAVGLAVRGLMLLTRNGFNLEELDQFGPLDNLPYSLDDDFWNALYINIVGTTTTPTCVDANGLKVFFGGPFRSVINTGIRYREWWTVGPAPLDSVTPTWIDFGLPMLYPGQHEFYTYVKTILNSFLGISPLGLPLEFATCVVSDINPRFRGHDWITRPV